MDDFLQECVSYTAEKRKLDVVMGEDQVTREVRKKIRCLQGIGCKFKKQGYCRYLHDEEDELVCRVCGEAGHTILQCRKAQCNYCHKLGHVSSICPDIVCRLCNKKGHSQKMCDPGKRATLNMQRRKQQNKQSVKCGHCGDIGHSKDNCPRIRVPQQQANRQLQSSGYADTFQTEKRKKKVCWGNNITI
jgi:hypothetical protein